MSDGYSTPGGFADQETWPCSDISSAQSPVESERARASRLAADLWLNVPIGVVLLPVAWTRLAESRGPAARLDLAGVILASLGLLGIVFGIAVLGAVFSAHGSYASGTAFVAGLAPAVWVGGAVVAAAAAAALFLPRLRQASPASPAAAVIPELHLVR